MEKPNKLHCDVEKPYNSLDLNGFCLTTMKLQVVIRRKQSSVPTRIVLGFCFMIEVGALLSLDKIIFEEGFMYVEFL